MTNFIINKAKLEEEINSLIPNNQELINTTTNNIIKNKKKNIINTVKRIAEFLNFANTKSNDDGHKFVTIKTIPENDINIIINIFKEKGFNIYIDKKIFNSEIILKIQWMSDIEIKNIYDSIKIDKI